MTNDDMRLVREYASRQSESAFAALVLRHTISYIRRRCDRRAIRNWRRKSPQVVFIILARKAAFARCEDDSLPAGFNRTAGYVSASALKTGTPPPTPRTRRTYMQSKLDAQAGSTLETIVSAADEAMCRLGQTDRDAAGAAFF